MKFAFSSVLLAAVLFDPGATAQAEQAVVATVNGHGISLPEFRRSLLEHRAAVFGDFQGRYGVDSTHPGFWTQVFGGEVPVEVLRQLALKDAVRIKVQLLMAHEKGLVRDVSYAAFLARLDQENRRRRPAVRDHEMICGPVQFDERAGFTHFFGLLVVRLKHSLADEEFDTTEVALRDYYKANKPQFTRPAEVSGRGPQARRTGIRGDLESEPTVHALAPREIGRYPSDHALTRVLRRRYVDDAYERLVAQRIREAEVIVNREVYHQMNAE